MKTDPPKLSNERLEEIKASLLGASSLQEANDLFQHFAALENEVTMVSHYYEESLIP